MAKEVELALLVYGLSQGRDELRARNERLTAALEGFVKLLEDNVLVRNIDDDADSMKFMHQGVRIIEHLAKTREALAGEGAE